MKDLVNLVLEQKGHKVLEEHKHCLENNISEAIQAGMPADKIAEIAFVVGFAHGVIDVMESIDTK
ncbi:hypothetical protein ACI1UM_06475 [Lactococcus petauri]|uniref:hypothetical protein n=1 Tax=Lactococcus petauri TaxID=1940789 RepID=UPI00385235FF